MTGNKYLSYEKMNESFSVIDIFIDNIGLIYLQPACNTSDYSF